MPTPNEPPRRSLGVLAADADPAAQAFYREALTALGHQVCVAESGRQLLDLCKAVTPDLVIVADRLPDATAADLAAALCRDKPLPIVLASDAATWEAAGCHVMGFLSKPLSRDALAAVVATAARCSAQLRTAREEADQLRQALEERKVVERAKGVVVRYCGLAEDDAYRRLRKLATEGSKKMAEVARDVLAAADVFERLAEDAPRPARHHANGPAAGVT
jgi:response regulator NasT